MRFQLIDAAKKEFPVQRMCKVLGVSQSGTFAWKDRPACRRQHQDMGLLAHVRSAFSLSNETCGSPRMTREDQGLRVGRRRTARLMRENGLGARQKRRSKRTTDSLHAFPVAPNLIDQDFSADHPDEKWGADISCLWTREGWLCLAPRHRARTDGAAMARSSTCSPGPRRWRGRQRPPSQGAGSRSTPEGSRHPTPRGRTDPPLGSRQPILLDRPSGRAQKAWPPDLNVREGKLLRQRHGRDPLQDVEIRAGLAHRLPDPGRSQAVHRPLHRRLPQSCPAPLGAQLRQPCPVRKADRHSNRSPLNQGKSKSTPSWRAT